MHELTATDLFTYGRRGEHPALVDVARPTPDRPVGFLLIDPGTIGAKPTHKWHRLGPPTRGADELEHRAIVAWMQKLADNRRFVAVKAFYPDEAGMLVAAVWARVEGLDGPVLLWVGYNARAAYAAAGVALAVAPAELLPEGIR